MTRSPEAPAKNEYTRRIVLAGYGDIAARVARRIGCSHPLLAVNRSGRAAVLPSGLRPYKSELRTLADQLEAGDTVMWLAPPPADDDVDSGLCAVLDAAPRLHKLIYLSTSGVYGDCHGGWVNESQIPAPQTPRARRRLAAETRCGQYATETGVPLAILRVPGIYGPGRLPRKRLERGLPTLAATISPWSNRIHAEDLAAVLVKLLDTGTGVFNISDGEPSTITEYFQAAAEVLKLPYLPEVDSVNALTPELASYMRESRRLDISKARNELEYTPQFPCFRRALSDCSVDDLQWELGAVHG